MTEVRIGASRRLRPTRRDVLRVAGLGAIAVTGFASPAIAQQRNVTFTLPWVPEGPNLITFVAKANGYWSKAGLEADIAKGTGSGAAAQAHGNGQIQFCLSAASPRRRQVPVWPLCRDRRPAAGGARTAAGADCLLFL